MLGDNIKHKTGEDIMSIVTIPQKMSGTGTIYDIASDLHDIEIDFGEHYQYAVVLAAYYNAKVTRHKTKQAAIRRSKVKSRQGYHNVTIIDRDGSYYEEYADTLRPLI